MMSDSWEGSFETDFSVKRPVEAQIQHTLNFIQSHEELLQRIEQNRNNVSEDTTSYRPIRIALDAPERASLYDILRMDDDQNDRVRKVLLVLVFLCDEIHELGDIAEEKFYSSLKTFGPSPLEENKGEFLIVECLFPVI